MDEKRFQQLATKKDLERFASKMNLERFATKEDLKRFATKDDLKRFATKDDLKRFATKDDLKKFATKKDLEKFSTKDEFNVLNYKLDTFKDDYDQHIIDYNKFKEENFNRFDEIIVILRRLDQERIFTTEWMKRIDSELEKQSSEIFKIKDFLEIR